MSTSPSFNAPERKHWWLTNRKIVDKYVKDARNLIATQEQSEIAAAVSLLDAALALSPRYEVALELKARSLLFLRRFRDVADMLQDHIPSLKMGNDDSGSVSSDNSSQPLVRDRVKLLPSSDSCSDSVEKDPSFKCFSVSDLKKKVMAGLCKTCDKEGQWRYLVLGQACCHLGLMEDAMVLLQTGKRLSTAAFRQQSISWSDDSFSVSSFPISGEINSSAPPTPPRISTESENISHMLSQIKFLLRRCSAAIAALDAGLYSEAIRHFSKIVDGRRGAPQGFLAECYMYRAYAYRSSGRIAESIADCNKTLALDPTCIQALKTRASLLETIRCLPDCLHDLEHIKLLYNSILRDRKLPGPAWKRQNVRYREIPGKLCSLTTKIQELKQRVASGETGNVDYYALIGLRRGCSRSELERAHLLLTLRHKPDKAISFVERCEFADDKDLDSVKDRARMSALLLYRLLQKGYTSVMNTIMDEERKKATQSHETKHCTMEKSGSKRINNVENVAALQAPIQVQHPKPEIKRSTMEKPGSNRNNSGENIASGASNPFQGVFCRDLAIVSDLLSQAGFNRPITVKYEALSC